MAGPESQTIEKAISGDVGAVQHLLNQLTSDDEETQSSVLSTIQSNEQPELWSGLLRLLAEGKWTGESAHLVQPHSQEHQRLGLKVRYLFLHDLMPGVSESKERVLTSGLEDETRALRAVSAELLGERGSGQATGPLASMLQDADDNVRWRAAQALGKITDPDSVGPLIACLSRNDPVLVHQARLALVAIGRPSVSPLVNALSDSNDQVRWEAAKALSEIRNPESAPALVKALEDNNAGVRWVAAEGVIYLEREGLQALLHALVRRRYTAWLGRGAHHIVLELRKGKRFVPVVSPVIDAMEGPEPAMEVPGAALAALKTLEESGDR